MPGLCATALAAPASADVLLQAMLQRMVHYPWQHPVAAGGDATAALGAVVLEPHARSATAISHDGQLRAVLYGEILAVDGASTRAAAGELSDVGMLLAAWQRDGADALARFNGEFAAALWDSGRQELHIITDRFGLRPVYIAKTAGGFAAASEIGAVLACPGVDTATSEAGIAQFFSFGHFYGADTLLRGVRAVPPATVGTYRVREATYHEFTYWHPSTSPAGDVQELRARFEDRFVAAVERRANPGERLGLSLSGGLDARSILGMVPPHARLQTISLGIEGSLDHKSAAELAAIAGVPHHQYMLDASFLSQFETHLRQMVRLTDGHYLDQGIVMPTMEISRRVGVDFLMRGHGGELLHMHKAYAFSLDDAALDASESQLESWLLSHLTHYMLDGVPDDLFRIDLRAGAATALREALARTTTTGAPVDRVWHLFLNERLHRETSMSMHLFGSFATIRQPFLDNDVIDALFAMPARMKLGEALQASLLRHRRPEFLGVTNSNTGAPLGAHPLRIELAKLRLRIGAKLGLKGYQPYERLGLWLRRELRDLVTRTLIGDRTLDGGIVNPDALRRVVSQHLEGRANHTFLIMSLLIFALGQESLANALPSARQA